MKTAKRNFLAGVLCITGISCTVLSSAIPVNWQDFIAPDMIEKYSGKSLLGFSSKYFQGDINGFDRDVPIEQLTAGLNNAISDDKKRWPNGVVPYTLGEQFEQEDRQVERTVIRLAMDIISSSTSQCIRFVKRTNQEDYIHIVRGLSCYSEVGRDGGKQIVSYTRGCLEEVGGVQHELMHVLGFYHEHSRSDRDQHIWISWSNLMPDHLRDFQVPTDSLTFGLPYDYESVLHYPFNAFAIKDTEPTIIPKETGMRIGQSVSLSQLDVIKLRKAYQCPGQTYESLVLNTDQVVTQQTTHRTRKRSRRVQRTTTTTETWELSLDDFTSNSLTDEQCKSLTTNNCFLSTDSVCPNGYFIFYCQPGASDSELRNHFEKLKNALPSTPIKFQIQGKVDFYVDTFFPFHENIVVLCIYGTVNFNTNALRDVQLPNLLELEFCYDTRLTITKNSLAHFSNLRVLEFGDRSTILLLEVGLFESLPSLKNLRMDGSLALPFTSDERDHLWRLHCSADYSWLRDYLDQHPDLIKSRKQSELYALPGLVSSETQSRFSYYHVDCSKNDLTGDANQVEFSLNEEE